MSGQQPAVSVAMITYNHEKYVREALRSVLDQTFTGFEVVVVNDGSTDRTGEVIRSVNDPRVRYVEQDNRGPSEALNRAIAECRCRFVALMSGDDVCLPGRLARQLDACARTNAPAAFADVQFIDEDGRPLTRTHFAETLFIPHTQTRAQLCRRFFTTGNCLNAPTAFLDRDALGGELHFDPLLIQCQDFELWVRLVKKFELAVIREPLLKYRIRDGNENLSSPDVDKQVRTHNEHYLILRDFFRGMGVPFFKEAFAEDLVHKDFASDHEFEAEKALLYFNSEALLTRLIGVERLYGLLSDPAAAAVLRDGYGLTPLRFAGLLKSVNVMNLFRGHESALYYDTGGGWDEANVVRLKVNLELKEFSLTFRLPAGAAVRAVRWDPMEDRFCTVKLDKVVVRREGGEERWDLARVEGNGTPQTDGSTLFETFDPMFVLPVTGEVSAVTFAGSWEHLDPRNALSRLERILFEKESNYRETERQLQAVLNSRAWRMTEPIRWLGAQVRGRVAA